MNRITKAWKTVNAQAPDEPDGPPWTQVPQKKRQRDKSPSNSLPPESAPPPPVAPMPIMIDQDRLAHYLQLSEPQWVPHLECPSCKTKGNCRRVKYNDIHYRCGYKKTAKAECAQTLSLHEVYLATSSIDFSASTPQQTEPAAGGVPRRGANPSNAELMKQVAALTAMVTALQEKIDRNEARALQITPSSSDFPALPGTAQALQTNTAAAMTIRKTTKKKNKTLSQIAGTYKETERPAVKAALQSLIHKPGPKPTNSAEATTNLRTVVLGSIAPQAAKDVKTALFRLRFLMSKIKNVTRIADHVFEFLVDASYTSAFKAKALACGMEVLDYKDTTKPLNAAASPQFVAAYTERVHNRLAGIIMKSPSAEVREFYTKMATEKNIMAAVTARIAQRQEAEELAGRGRQIEASQSSQEESQVMDETADAPTSTSSQEST